MPRKKKAAPPAEPENTVTIGDQTWTPRLPRSLCWAGKSPPTAQYHRAGWDPMAYGGAVMDELVERGLAWDEVYAAGMICLSHVVDAHLGEEEVSTAENFTDAEGG